MKVIESYWKDTVAVCLVRTLGRVYHFFGVISDFPSNSYAIFIRSNEGA